MGYKSDFQIQDFEFPEVQANDLVGADKIKSQGISDHDGWEHRMALEKITVEKIKPQVCI